MCAPLFVYVEHGCCIVHNYLYCHARYDRKEGTAGFEDCQEFQAVDVEFPFFRRPRSMDLKVVAMSSPTYQTDVGGDL